MSEQLVHIDESRFGVWFLGTETWAVHVLARAIKDLQRLLPPNVTYDTILDVGCGWGRSFALLDKAFAPRRMIGIDSDPEMLRVSADEIARIGVNATVHSMNAAALAVPDASIDMIFCHQTLHHIVAQDDALKEFYRVLKPGGVLVLAESTRHYIHSWIIRLLFRHDMTVQRSADEFLQMIRNAGFSVPASAISYPYLWWSRRDLGLLERLLRVPPPKNREETLMNLVATKRA